MSLPCTHGLVGFCPDCPPERFRIGVDMVAPSAVVRPGRDGLFVVVARTKASGAFDWFTWHFTRWGARRAARLYLQTGRVVGWRP